MCGIFGYTGNRQAKDVIIQGLKKLEYRGYDSSGLSVIFNNNISTLKCKGDVSTLDNIIKSDELKGNAGVGHTRWATHGVASEVNAHPHNSADNCFSIVHNGIIDNYLQLKEFAQKKGYKFISDTDSEIIAALLQLSYDGDVLSTIRTVMNMLCGAFAVAIVTSYNPDTVFAFKMKSPLVIGQGLVEYFVSSDIYAFSKDVNSYYTLNDGEIAVVSKNVKFYDSFGNVVEKTENKLSYVDISDELGGYEHYMLKEIYEQSSVVNKTFNEFRSKNDLLSKCSFDNIYLVGCGSAYNAAMIGAFVFEQMCHIKAKAIVASEYYEGLSMISANDLLIAISQSGETSDTISSVREVKQRVNCKVLSIVNVEDSSLAVLSDYVLYTNAGKEVSVATTKGYFSQVLMLLMIADGFAENKFITNDKVENLISNIETILKIDVSMCIDKIVNSNVVFFIGKGIDYFTAVEAALKLKEVCYINAEAYPSGELKHGSIALIDDRTVVVMICTDIKYLNKNISAVKEASARGGYVLCLITKECIDLKLYADEVIVIPSLNNYMNSLISIVPLQLVAYNSATRLGVNVDKPRNLAKSVTVE